MHSNNQKSEDKCMTITTAAFGILISPSVSQLYSYLCTGHENVGQYNHNNEKYPLISIYLTPNKVHILSADR